MTPDEIRAAIAADPALLALVPDSVSLAAHQTFAGRTRIVEHRVSELGVRKNLGVVDASRFLAVLKTAAASDAAGQLDAWLVAVLTAMGVPADVHGAYQETVGSAWRWLTQPEGLDVGSAAARGMIDLIAAGNPSLAPACEAIKALAQAPDPVSEYAIRCAIWRADGSLAV